MKTIYREVSLKSVMEYYIKGFRSEEKEKIFETKYFIDIQKGEVIFKIYIEGG